ncbi:hypothetical protein HELRODRAFT_181379 [Helobdella robusta]|uniref:Uncharacterized protein n=1 Tax=Helobdella robusta TaxID=6412 RepID=T1FGX9_HELRO|nr:hypothetical protein HELRODRAFT_181379 [Helobdella robusta]ESN92505.1 hypothetical protein HELRODRAFT_181379 [Helobdella robusta]
MKERLQRMEEEAEKLRKIKQELEQMMGASTAVDKSEIDTRSTNYANILKILVPSSGRPSLKTNIVASLRALPTLNLRKPKGVDRALQLDESLIHDREIWVERKSTNMPGLSTTNRRPRGRGVRIREGVITSHNAT